MSLAIPNLTKGAAAAHLVRRFNAAIERGEPSPRLLIALPPIWANKYQLLLYSEAVRSGYEVVGIQDLDVLDNVFWPGEIVLHAHWFASLFSRCSSKDEAEGRLDLLIEKIECFKARTGARLIWTAHNVFPHGNLFPETFLRLRREILMLFDAVHVMDHTHLKVLQDRVGATPRASFVVPHMTYDGTIIDTVGREAARAAFDIPPDAFVFGVFGAIQPYKQIPSFLEKISQLRLGAIKKPVFAFIAGQPSDVPTHVELVTRWGDSAHVRMVLRKIYDHEIQYIYKSSDIMVLPYQESLNSGAAFMAMTFRKNFIAPATPALQRVADAGLGARLFDPDKPGTLLALMEQAVEEGVEDICHTADYSQYEPRRVSKAFFQELSAIQNKK